MDLNSYKTHLETISMSLKQIPEQRNPTLTVQVCAALFEPRFICLLSQAEDKANDNRTKKIIAQNHHDEINEDHPQLLRNMLASANIPKTKEANDIATKLYGNILQYHSSNRPTTGLALTNIFAVLENTSRYFVPIIENCALKVGGPNTDIEYTQRHGPADIIHAEDANKAVIYEHDWLQKNNINPEGIIETSSQVTLSMLEELFISQTFYRDF